MEVWGFEPQSCLLSILSHLQLSKISIGRNQQTTMFHFTQNGLTDEIYTLSHEWMSNLFYDRVLDDSVPYAA